MLEISNSEDLGNAMIQLAHMYPNLPIAVINEGGVIKLGVMSLYQPEDDDWFFLPVAIGELNVQPKAKPTPSEKGLNGFPLE